MIMNAKKSQREIGGDTNARGRARSRRLELYRRSIFGKTEEKIRPELLPPGDRPRLACKIDEDEIKKRRR